MSTEEAERAEEENPVEYGEFAFKVPKAPEGATLKVPAPDGMVLKIPLPKNVKTGMKLVMHKSAETNFQWRIKCAEDADEEPTPASGSNAGYSSAPPQQQQQPPQAPQPPQPQQQAPQRQEPPPEREDRKPAAAKPRPGQVIRPRTRNKGELDSDLAGPQVVMVRLSTTKGDIMLKIVPDWAPLGTERFLQLVDDGYYSAIAIYRAVPKFLVQFGIVKDKARTSKYKKIQDDPLCGVPIQDGTVIFAAAGANTRKSTVCLFLGDYPQLGSSPWETPIGKVVPDSMDTLHSIYTGYGDIPQCGGKGPDPHKLEELGNDYIAESFPQCDYVTGAARV